MKQVVILCIAIFGTALAAHLPNQNQYLPPKNGGSPIGHGPNNGQHGGQHGGHHDSVAVANNYQQQQYSGQASQHNHAKILRLENEVNSDSYNYAYETDDGTKAEEQGHLNGENLEAQGSFSFVAPDGQQFSIQYVSGENGFQPQGAHIPTAPPVPEEILKGLQQNAQDEAQGVFDDGQYHPEESWAHANGHKSGNHGGSHGGHSGNAGAHSGGHSSNAGNGGYKY